MGLSQSHLDVVFSGPETRWYYMVARPGQMYCIVFRNTTGPDLFAFPRRTHTEVFSNNFLVARHRGVDKEGSVSRNCSATPIGLPRCMHATHMIATRRVGQRHVVLPGPETRREPGRQGCYQHRNKMVGKQAGMYSAGLKDMCVSVDSHPSRASPARSARTRPILC